MKAIDLSGKVALVTGASQGLGSATTRALHAAGATVVINFFPDPDKVNESRAQVLAAELGERSLFVGADVRDPGAVDRMFEAVRASLGGIDIVVNNAAVLRDRTIRNMTDEDWQAVIDTNLTGVFHMNRAAARHLRDDGRIVSMASIAATVGFFGQANYAAAKAGVAAMTRVLSRELARRRITVNAVAPGVVLTEMGKSIPEGVRESMLAQIPLGRFGEPDEIANVILFLCSPLASYITGQTLHVNGGWTS
ncbi:MAG: 3-oxoacyl-ACP reductase FabG [Planctomycetes bacterium]|jgi:3-oxoacyl-[acyl-carrier protein] reductase|nr:3-oxoacyl-ACP reductase FabG [Planctomycetota bacterium]